MTRLKYLRYAFTLTQEMSITAQRRPMLRHASFDSKETYSRVNGDGVFGRRFVVKGYQTVRVKCCQAPCVPIYICVRRFFSASRELSTRAPPPQKLTSEHRLRFFRITSRAARGPSARGFRIFLFPKSPPKILSRTHLETSFFS